MASEKQLTRKVEWLMKQCDSDGDGQISFDEFVNLAKKFPNIVFPAYSLASGLGGLSK
jgi:serine/threonine-protein phosphatase 2B regulatory subunit